MLSHQAMLMQNEGFLAEYAAQAENPVIITSLSAIPSLGKLGELVLPRGFGSTYNAIPNNGFGREFGGPFTPRFTEVIGRLSVLARPLHEEGLRVAEDRVVPASRWSGGAEVPAAMPSSMMFTEQDVRFSPNDKEGYP